MSENTASPGRSAEAIEQDFAELMASRLPQSVARDKFETLWDETNSLAAKTVHTIEGQPYLSLLKRMHQTFESRYPVEGSINGNSKRRS